MTVIADIIINGHTYTDADWRADWEGTISAIGNDISAAVAGAALVGGTLYKAVSASVSLTVAECENRVFVFSGTTGADIAVYFDVSFMGLALVENHTNHGIYMVLAGQTPNVFVPSTGVALVFCDGTGCYTATGITTTSSGVAITGALTATGGVNAAGLISSTGSAAGLRTTDRTTGAGWLEFASGGTYYLYYESGAYPVWYVDTAGNMNVRGNLNFVGSGGTPTINTTVVNATTINNAGALTVTGATTLQGGVTVTGSVSATGVGTFSDHVSTNYVSGHSPGGYDAGALKLFDSASVITFRMDLTANKAVYRIDDSYQAYICTSLNAFDMLISYGGGPTTVNLYTYDVPANLYGIYVDALSDERIKQNIKPTQVDALAVLSQIPVVEFEVRARPAAWIKSIGEPDIGKRKLAMDQGKPVHQSIGLIAQAVKPHIPEAVNVLMQDKASADSPLPLDTHTIQHEAFVPYLVRAVQQLSARVEALESALQSAAVHNQPAG